MSRNQTSSMPRRMLAALALGAVLVGGCAWFGGAKSSSAAVEAAAPRYAEAGPYDVGVTTLKLKDRSVEVYYPAPKGSTAGKPRERYLQTDPIPPAILSRLPKIPDNVDLSVTIPAARDVAASKSGPYPLVLFSHGAGGYRMAYGEVLAGLASWGFVVASTDYTEYGFVSNLMGGGGGDMTRRREAVAGAVAATIDLMTAEASAPGGRFNGVIDASRIGAVGHSAGGGTMFGQLNNPKIRVIVGWAPVPPQTPVTSTTPTMIVTGDRDIAIPAQAAINAYDSLNAPKRLVLVRTMGHNAFSDTCVSIQGGTDLISLAKQLGLPIPDRLLSLAANGCSKDDLAVKQGFALIQHFTVAELRERLGVDKRPVGLGQAIDKAFPGVSIDYRQKLK